MNQVNYPISCVDKSCHYSLYNQQKPTPLVPKVKISVNVANILVFDFSTEGVKGESDKR